MSSINLGLPIKPHIIINDLNDFAFAELMVTHIPERVSLRLTRMVPVQIVAAVFAKLPPSRALIIDSNTAANNILAITNLSKEDNTFFIMALLADSSSSLLLSAKAQADKQVEQVDEERVKRQYL